MREVYWIGDRFIVEWEDGRVEEFEVEKIEELKKELNLRDRIEFELSMIERDDFYGGDNWELFKWWMELEEVFMWLYDLSNE